MNNFNQYTDFDYKKPALLLDSSRFTFWAYLSHRICICYTELYSCTPNMISIVILSVLLLCGCSSTSADSCNSATAENLVDSFGLCEHAISCFSDDYCECCDHPSNQLDDAARECCEIYDEIVGEVSACGITADDLRNGTSEKKQISEVLETINHVLHLADSLISCLSGGGDGGGSSSDGDDGFPTWAIATLVIAFVVVSLICICVIVCMACCCFFKSRD